MTGGGRPAHLAAGWYVEPTVFADVDNSMKIAQEEIFGPVLSVIPYDDVDNAVKIANDSDYGLCGSVWTGDPAGGEQIAARMRTGCGRDQLVDDPRLQQPLRRLQAVGHRPRARPRGHRPVHRVPVDRSSCGLDIRELPCRWDAGHVGHGLCVQRDPLCRARRVFVGVRRRRRGRALAGRGSGSHRGCCSAWRGTCAAAPSGVSGGRWSSGRA